MQWNGRKINILGDSITEGYGATSKSYCYAEQLKRCLSLSEIRNYGLGGTRIARQKTTYLDPLFDRDFCQRFGQMDADADAVLVFGGTNDYGHGDAPFGADSDRTPDSFCGACHFLLQGLKKKYPNVPVMILTPTHRANDDLFNSNGNRLVDYVNAIRNTAEFYSLPVLDLYACSSLQFQHPHNAELFSVDGLHPNNLGHSILAEEIAQWLQRI